jgi:hypothetical protein
MNPNDIFYQSNGETMRHRGHPYQDEKELLIAQARANARRRDMARRLIEESKKPGYGDLSALNDVESHRTHDVWVPEADPLASIAPQHPPKIQHKPKLPDLGPMDRRGVPLSPTQIAEARAKVAEVRIEKALAIHDKVNDPRPGKDAYCGFCSSAYPCDTVQALTDSI